jgi:hypothetical protein
MQNRVIKIVVGLLLVTVTAGIICFAWKAVAQPKYTAQAAFSVDWNNMPVADKDGHQEQARHRFNKAITKLKVSDQFITILCEECKVPSAETEVVRKKLAQHLRVLATGNKNGCDWYVVKFDDNNPQFALRTTDLLCSRIVDRLNTKARVQAVSQGLNNYAENADVQAKDQRLRMELANLSQQQHREFSSERKARIQEIGVELNQTDVDQMKSGFGLLANVVQLFSSPAKVERFGEVQKRG